MDISSCIGFNIIVLSLLPLRMRLFKDDTVPTGTHNGNLEFIFQLIAVKSIV